MSARFVRTSSFRLTLLYAAMFCASFLILFGLIYWSSAQFMERQIDTTVSREVADLHFWADEGPALWRGRVDFSMAGRVVVGDQSSFRSCRVRDSW